MNEKVSKIQEALEKTNGNLKQAAELIGMKYPTLYWNVKKYNLTFNNEKEKIDASRVKELYDKYQSLSLVAKELGCTKEGVRTLMQREGININEPIRYSFNERFFSEDTEKSFYWAGFIAADGCLKKQGNSDVLSIGLAVKDKSHLEKFKIDLESNHPIHHGLIKNSKRNSAWKDSERVEVKLLSKHLPGDLARFNITQRKTHTYKFPDWLKNHLMVNHFMRGYFDGDGSWYGSNNCSTNKVQYYFSLRGTEEFLEGYRAQLEIGISDLFPTCERSLSKGYWLNEHKPRYNSGIYTLEYGGNGHACKIRDFLYKDATIFMDRKYELVKDVSTLQRLDVQPRELISLMKELGEQKKIAKKLGCSPSTITRLVKHFEIESQMKAAKAKYR